MTSLPTLSPGLRSGGFGSVAGAHRFLQKYMNCPARASKSAMPTYVSRFLSEPLVQKPYETLYEEPQEKIRQTPILLFFLLFSSFALPAAAGHRSYIHQGHILKRSRFGQNPTRSEVTESLALFSWNSFRKKLTILQRTKC